MKIKTLLVTSLLALSLSPSLSFAENTDHSELAQPVIKLMPHFIAMRDDLKLTTEQATTIDGWIKSAPQKRKELAQEAINIRAELREALLNRDTRIKRDALKSKLAATNTRLIEMSSLCARMLHKTLTKEQYAKVVAQYKSKL